MFLTRVKIGFFEGVYSFQPNRQKGPRHWKGWEPLV